MDRQTEVEGGGVSFDSSSVLFGKLRPYLAKVARPDFEGVCSGEILVLRSYPIYDRGYLFYCLISAPHIDWIDALTYGAKMPRASPEQIMGNAFPVPPVPEQRAVAKFLDRETTRIDALIAKKNELIRLLEERSNSIIAHAVITI